MKVAVVAHSGRNARRRCCSSFVSSSGSRRESPSRSGLKCRRAVRRRRGFSGLWTKASSSCSSWGGDGMVQQCVECARRVGREPRGHPCRDRGATAPIEPGDPEGHRAGSRARAAWRRRRRCVDGHFNGERFAVMAGAGFDAAMIPGRKRSLKGSRIGRVATTFGADRRTSRLKPFSAG